MSTPLPSSITCLTLEDVKSHVANGTWLNSYGFEDHPQTLHHRKVVAIDIAGFPLIVKFGTMVSLTEAEVVRYVARRTSIPVPTIYHTFVDANRPFTVTYIVEERLPGNTLRSVLPVIDVNDQQTLARELTDIMSQLSTLTTDRTQLGPISGPWRNSYFAPFLSDYPCTIEDARTTQDFIEYFLRIKGYRDPFQPIKTTEESLQPFDLQRSPLFSHGDMVPTNILVEGGHVTGIIDWHEAGWYPYFWDDFVAAEAAWKILSQEERDKWAAICPNIPLTFREENSAFGRIWGYAGYYF